MPPRTSNRVGILYFTVFCVAQASAQLENEFRPVDLVYGVSSGGEYVVRAASQTQYKDNATIQLFAYAPERHAYVPKARQVLPSEKIPFRLLVVQNGRYVIGLGMFYANHSDFSHAIWLWDTQRNVTRSFALNDFLSPSQIERFVVRFHMVPSVLWFSGQDHESPFYDPVERKVYVTPGINVFSPTNRPPAGADVETKLRFWANIGRQRPMVVIDLIAMSVSTVESREVPFWKRRYDEFATRTNLAQELLSLHLGVRGGYMVALVEQAVQAPTVQIKASRHQDEGDWLCRLEPGNARRRGRLIVMKYVENQRTYRAVRIFTLRNRVAPAVWIPTPTASHVITLDELGQMGMGDNVVAIYEVSTGTVKGFRLEDFLSDKAIQQLRTHKRFRVWRAAPGGVSIRGRGLENWSWAHRDTPEHVPRVVIDVDQMTVRTERDGAR